MVFTSLYSAVSAPISLSLIKNGVMKRKQKEVIPDEVMKAAKEYLDIGIFKVQFLGRDNEIAVYNVIPTDDSLCGFPPVFYIKNGKVYRADVEEGMDLICRFCED